MSGLATGSQNPVPNRHADPERCLTEPQTLAFTDPLNNDTVDLWLVLEEDSETRNGYKVVHDEINESCGLAITDARERPVFLGLYGGFLNAYDAM